MKTSAILHENMAQDIYTIFMYEMASSNDELRDVKPHRSPVFSSI